MKNHKYRKYLHESAYIVTKGVFSLMYPQGHDYIKYLNDESAYGLTYDQWKDKKSKEEKKNQSQVNYEKMNLNQYPKYKY